MEVKDLQELFKQPGWQVYLDQVEEAMLLLFVEMWQLDVANANSYGKFVELKAKIDQLRNITYFYERELAGDAVGDVDKSYMNRLRSLFKKLTRRLNDAE